MKKKLLTIAIIAIITTICSFSFVALAKEFSDIDQSHWAFQYVDELSNQGVINGYDDGTYKPDNTVTRAEFIKLVLSTDGRLIKNGEFTIQMKDLKFDNWYDKYVYIAGLSDLIPYAYTSGDYNEPIERYEMAGIIEELVMFEEIINYENSIADFKSQIKDVAIQKAYELKLIKNKKMSYDEFDKEWQNFSQEQQDEVMRLVNENFEIINEEPEHSFDDILGLNGLDIRAIDTCKELGIINGYEDGSFRPNNKMTRAEVAVVISRLSKLIEGAKK